MNTATRQKPNQNYHDDKPATKESICK